MNCNTHAPHEAKKKLPRAKRIRCSIPVIPQILIISSRKDSRQTASWYWGKGDGGMEKCFVHTNGTDLCRAKQLMGGRRKMDVCCVVSCHGGQLKAHCKAGANSHPLLIPQFLSSRLQPSIPSLIFISASVMRTKKSTHSLAPPAPLCPSAPQPTNSLLPPLHSSSLLRSVSSGKTCRPD